MAVPLESEPFLKTQRFENVETLPNEVSFCISFNICVMAYVQIEISSSTSPGHVRPDQVRFFYDGAQMEDFKGPLPYHEHGIQFVIRNTW